MNKSATITATFLVPLFFLLWVGFEENWPLAFSWESARLLGVAGLAAWAGVLVSQFKRFQYQKYGSLNLLMGFMFINYLLISLYSSLQQSPTAVPMVWLFLLPWFFMILPFTGFLMLSKQPEMVSIAQIILGGVASVMTFLMALYMLDKSPAHTALLLYVSACTAAVAFKSLRAPSTRPDHVITTHDSPSP